jgi:menaquinone reductase, multiheme cytochrome c subunit
MQNLRGALFFFTGLAMALAFGWHAFPKLIYEVKQQPVQFSHKIHTGDEVGLTCDGCHSFREDGSFAGVPKLDTCAPCHQEPVSDKAHEKHFVAEYVAKEREVNWLVYSRQPDNVYFPHAPHVQLAKLKCEECHGNHGSTDNLRPLEVNRISGYSRDLWGSSRVRMVFLKHDGMKMQNCVDCHKEKNVTAGCLACHK